MDTPPAQEPAPILNQLPEEPAPHPMSTVDSQIPLLPAPHRKRWPFIFGLVIVGILLVAIGVFITLSSTNKPVVELKDRPSQPTSVKASGKIVVGTDPTFAPMEFLNEAGDYAGYDIDLAKRLAEKLGVAPQFKTIVFDDFVKEVNNGTIDVFISAVSITDERKAQVLFSDPYMYAGQVILTKKLDTTIKTTADLQGKKIAVQRGTTNEVQARAFTEEPNILLYDDYELATQALLSGKADAIFSDLTGAKGIIDANPTLKVASEPFTQETYGIVMRKDAQELADDINAALNDLRQQGVLTLLKQKWLE